MTDRNALEGLRRRIDRLPLVDVAAFDVIGLLNDPNSTYDQVVDRLSPDIAARFLNLANSAYYGMEVRSIGHAVKLLGYNAMRQYLVTSFLIEHFTRHLDMEAFDFDRFQSRSQLTAILARSMGDVLEYRNAGDLYTAAVLHNLGELVMAVYFEPEHRRAAAADRPERTSLERELLGADRYEIGAMVLERFNIPAPICRAIRCIPGGEGGTAEAEDPEMALALRQAVDLASGFADPDEAALGRLAARMKQAVAAERSVFRASMSEGLKRGGYLELLPEFVKAVAGRLKPAVADALEPAGS